MPLIRPFRGIRYNLSEVNIDTVVAPPYDVISPEQQNQLYDKDPRNIVRLILGREEDRYTAAAKTFTEWQNADILMRDNRPSFYALVQTFTNRDGRTVQRRGFIALCRLEEFEKGIILPHEKTLSKAKEDRFKLFQATNSNFSQIFALYSDAEKIVDGMIAPFEKFESSIDVTFENVRNQLWVISDVVTVEKISQTMKPKQVLIADGHHRYETGLAYRDLMKSKNPSHTGAELYNYIMMFFTNLDDEGLVIFPTHRVVHSLQKFDWNECSSAVGKYFSLVEFPSMQAMGKALGSRSRQSYGIIVGKSPKFFIADLKDEKTVREIIPSDIPGEVKDLDVVLLHSYILAQVLGISAEAQEKKLNIHYLQSADECAEKIRSGGAQIAFIVNPTRIEQVRAVAKAGRTMPQKSTFFYPKLLSGLVLNTMTE